MRWLGAVGVLAGVGVGGWLALVAVAECFGRGVDG